MQSLGNTSQEKNVLFQALPKLPLPPPPNSGKLYNFFWTSKNDVWTRITEPSNDDYHNYVSDNCDHNFGTLDDFGVKNAQKVSHNMILRWKKGLKKFGQGPPPPFYGAHSIDDHGAIR